MRRNIACGIVLVLAALASIAVFAPARALAAEALVLDSPKEIYARCDAFYRARVKVE